jgi:ketosteroid isomerase-like protein
MPRMPGRAFVRVAEAPWLRDTGRVMPEESTTSDLVKRVRRYVEAASRRDFHAIEAFYTPDAVLHGAQIGTFEGPAAARGVLEDISGPYEEFHAEADEIVDLGFGVTFAVIVARGHIAGSSAEVRFHFASVAMWREGLVERQTNYTDIDEARAAAERLAEERG